MAPWEDDNDPRAKGLRGWDAARALCIGTGRALRDVKSVVNLAPWVTKKPKNLEGKNTHLFEVGCFWRPIFLIILNDGFRERCFLYKKVFFCWGSLGGTLQGFRAISPMRFLRAVKVFPFVFGEA